MHGYLTVEYRSDDDNILLGYYNGLFTLGLTTTELMKSLFLFCKTYNITDQYML